MPTVLIIGGSQGAQKINKVIYEILPKLLKFTKVVHLTGSLGLEEAKRERGQLEANLRRRYVIHNFLEEMPEMMHKADLIISRAGANALSEIAVLGEPSILIPLKLSASDHQTKNAQIFEKNKAAILIREDDLTGNILLNKIKNLILDKSRLEEMGEEAKKLSQPKAAFKIVQEILRLRE